MAFNNFGLNLVRHFNLPSENSKLQLIAAGMRRKNLFVLEVDVYVIGVYVGENFDETYIKERHTQKGSYFDMGKSSTDHISVCFTLTFVRSVGTSTLVDTIVTSLSGNGDEYNNALELFKTTLLNIVGKGIKKNDTVEFCFQGNDASAIGIGFNNSFGGWVHNEDIRARLISLYTGERAVVPQVATTISQRYIEN